MIGVYIPASDMTDEQYKAIDDELNADGPPPGMKLHTCFREGTKLAVLRRLGEPGGVRGLRCEADARGSADGCGVALHPQFVEMVDDQVV